MQLPLFKMLHRMPQLHLRVDWKKWKMLPEKAVKMTAFPQELLVMEN